MQVPINQANVVKKEIGAHIFEEISAKENMKVDEVFETMASILLDRHKHERSESVFLKGKGKEKEKKGCC